MVTIVHACLAFIEAPPGGLKESDRDAAIFDVVIIVGGICNAIYVVDAAFFVYAVGIREKRFGSTGTVNVHQYKYQILQWCENIKPLIYPHHNL